MSHVPSRVPLGESQTNIAQNNVLANQNAKRRLTQRPGKPISSNVTYNNQSSELATLDKEKSKDSSDLIDSAQRVINTEDRENAITQRAQTAPKASSFAFGPGTLVPPLNNAYSSKPTALLTKQKSVINILANVASRKLVGKSSVAPAAVESSAPKAAPAAGLATTASTASIVPPAPSSASRKRQASEHDVVSKRIRESEPDVHEFDVDDLEDPAQCAEYAQDIMTYLHERELTFMPDPNYIRLHDDIAWDTRRVLMDWMIEVHAHLQLLPETLYLSVNIVDRVLSVRKCELSRLQLLGVTALFIAAKTEEIRAPSVSTFTYMMGEGFSDSRLFEAEQYILRVLDYVFWAPGPLSFIRRISKADDYDFDRRSLAKYFSEMTLLHEEFLAYRPSMIAASSMWLARLVSGQQEWDENFIFASQYKVPEFLDCAKLIARYLGQPKSKETYFLTKYSSRKFFGPGIKVYNLLVSGALDRAAAAAAAAADVASDDSNGNNKVNGSGKSSDSGCSNSSTSD